jgi:hypothetical protein
MEVPKQNENDSFPLEKRYSSCCPGTQLADPHRDLADGLGERTQKAILNHASGLGIEQFFALGGSHVEHVNGAIGLCRYLR